MLAAWVVGWAVSAGAFNILVTNDDGIHAEGLAVLASELSQVGNVFVVAPDQNHSGSSHSTSLVGQEFTIKRTENQGVPEPMTHVTVTAVLRYSSGSDTQTV